jgi:biopolymer transport protein ExbB
MLRQFARTRKADRQLRQMRLAFLICGIACLVSGAARVGAQEPVGAAPESAAFETPALAPPASEGGNAPAAAEPATEGKDLIPTDPVDLFLAGGVLMWPILLASVVAIWIGLERMVILRRRRVIPRAFVDRFLKHLEQGQLDAESALKLCDDNDSPVAAVFAHGVRKWGKPSVEVEQAIIDGGERQVGSLRTHLRVLNGVYTVSPLLGLLGTVVGMIMSFNQLAQGGTMGQSERLAAGIAVALLTTAAGLIVAIPALILYMYLAGRVDALVMEMDSLSQQVVNLISAEGLAARPRQAARAAAAASPPASAATAPKLKQPLPTSK